MRHPPGGDGRPRGPRPQDREIHQQAGGPHDSSYPLFPIRDVLLLLSWDLKFNDRFVHFSSVFRKTTGTAIGGATSVQTSSVTLLYMERSVDTTPILPPCFEYRDTLLILTIGYRL